MGPDAALLLGDLRVSVAMHDDEHLPDEALLERTDVAHEVLVKHLREAKAALADLGVSVHWSEDL